MNEAATNVGSWSDADLLRAYRTMLLIREFEELAGRLYANGDIPGFCHLSVGQEATAVGGCQLLEPNDVITSTHRGHGHALAKGADPVGMFAELLGREGGLCRGRGGSMHIADTSAGILGANGIVGAGLPIAVGAALGLRLAGDGGVAVAFFGDGAIAQGAFHESLNLAALWRLPVVFLCENNQYAEFTATADQHPVPLPDRARAYGLPADSVDGSDVLAVLGAMSGALERARAGDGPTFVVAESYRLRGHYEGDGAKYRPDGEAERARSLLDPLPRLRATLAKHRERSKPDLDTIDHEVARVLAEALAEAQAMPEPAPDTFDRYVTRPRVPIAPAKLSAVPKSATRCEPETGTGTTKYAHALNAALRDALREDERVYLAGIDIGAGQGVFRVTRGLLEEFGPDRVRDTPIGETALLGSAVGAAMVGRLAVVELMYNDFLGVCLDPLLNQAAKLGYMTGGHADMALVVRTQYGAGRSSAAQHSQSLEGLLAAIPGLTVVAPSSPADAYGLLRSAIDDPNPVIVFEHRHLYGSTGEAAPPGHRVPIGEARVVMEGVDVTAVAWGRMLHETVKASTALQRDGISIEVIDLRTIAPWDIETVLASVAKTSRLAIVHEAHGPFGPGAEIAATVSDRAVWQLDAPIRRITPAAVPAPYAPSLEAAWLPDAERIEKELRALVSL